MANQHREKGTIMKKLFLAACCISLLSGCIESWPEKRVNALKKPVVIVAISTSGAVTVQGADGTIVVLPDGTYIASTFATRKVGDVVITAR